MKLRTGLQPAFQGLLEINLSVRVRDDCLVVDVLPDRRHHDERQEERDRRHHLIRRQLLRADRLPQQAENDDDPHEAGRHQEHSRGQAEHRRDEHDLDRRAEPFGAGPAFRPASRLSGSCKLAGAFAPIFGHCGICGKQHDHHSNNDGQRTGCAKPNAGNGTREEAKSRRGHPSRASWLFKIVPTVGRGLLATTVAAGVRNC